ncbi:ankyrin repeat-containing domain protein [Aspergillus parasiticus]|uniref:Ankyrin repeat-containing domain protein n=1 Tax=Aspergillus parasiticus TaxID=5067 RepID=A0A5N6E2L6_ASPPA|nr:ankyrin repeat-containing domain protein [Aspergillus parasiticus]
MRLLNTKPSDTGNFIIEEFFGEPPPYAILSHTWQEMEVTFQDITTGVIDKKGFKKVKDCYTCCIDKTSSAELSESLNSMYRWYQEAGVCYAYLADVPSKPFAKSRWFKRGWTLQELIAPSTVIFLDHEWNELGTRESLQDVLSDITSIPVGILVGEDDVETASVAQRMSWAARRETTRIEDRAYCLMGLFGINMPPIYGEGKNAFIRLQEEIMKVLDDHSIFAWRSDSEEENHGGLLATSPDAFRESSNVVPYNPFTTIEGPLTCGKFQSIDLGDLKPSQYPLRRLCVQQRRPVTCRDTETNWINTNGISGNGQTLLSHAAGRGDVDMLWLLLTRSDVSAGGRDLSGRTPLSRAAECGQEAIVRLLLCRNDVDPDYEDKNGRSPLSHAAASGHLAIVKLLLQSGRVDKHDLTPLAWAAGKGREEASVGTRADIESEDYIGRTPLSSAAHRGQEATMKLLLQHGANVESHDHRGHTPLIYAVENEREAIVKLLLQNGAQIESCDNQGLTPLCYAARKGYEEIAKLLLENDADLEAPDSRGQTPLSWAAENGHGAIVKLLLEKGANIESHDCQGRTPLFYATKYKHEVVANLLQNDWVDMGQSSSAK